MPRTSRPLFVSAFAALLLALFAAFDVAPATPAVAQVEEPAPESPGLGKIIGSPDPGPDPEDPGDRGGWAQLGLAVLLFGAVAFIGTRIVAGARRSGT